MTQAPEATVNATASPLTDATPAPELAMSLSMHRDYLDWYENQSPTRGKGWSAVSLSALALVAVAAYVVLTGVFFG